MNKWTKRAAKPFYFYTRLNLCEMTGLKAYNLRELASRIKEVPGSCIYHHTHVFLEQHRYLSPEPPNDFAYWTSEVLGEEELGEELGSIDICEFTSIRALREKIIGTIEKFLFENKRESRSVPRGKEFHFIKAHTFILPASRHAFDLKGFVEALKGVSILSIYYHMFESRLRLERGVNDFSLWIESSLGMPSLAGLLSSLDPYTFTLEDLRKKIIDIITDFCRQK